MQTPMSGKPTYVKLDPKIMKYAVDLYPELEKMVERYGCLYIVLLKTLYGCVQANALWYALIRKVLEDLGYKVDPCMFVKQVGDRIFILDDILVIVNEKEAKRLNEWLVARLRSIQFEAKAECPIWGWTWKFPVKVHEWI